MLHLPEAFMPSGSESIRTQMYYSKSIYNGIFGKNKKIWKINKNQENWGKS
jgi:hypothetical protein